MARRWIRAMAWLAATGAVVAALAAAGAARSGDEDTHGRDAVPDYARVFNQDQVGRLDVRIDATDWQAVLADMQNMAGPSGFGLNVPFSNEQFAACAGRLEANACVAGDPPVAGRCAQTFPPGRLACLPIGGAGAGRDEVELLPRTPIYVPADISFDGETFRRVGYRLKGNSTLLLTWRRGSDKLPFRLNFDGLEARFPETRDQTFFGFPNLSFTNNGLDNTYLRGKVVTDLFRDAGVPSAATAFMRVFLDRGNGPSYQGLFTMLEVPDRPMLERVFGSNDGNLYKPHGTGGRWTIFDSNAFSKRTNQEAEDWTDIEDAIAALHASRADRAALAEPPGGALRRAGVPAVAGAQHDHRQHRRLRRRVGAQLLRLRQPTPSGSAVLDPVGSRSGDADGVHAGRPPAAGYLSQQHAVELAAHQVPVGRPRVSRRLPREPRELAGHRVRAWPRHRDAAIRAGAHRALRRRARGGAVRAEPGRERRTVRRRPVRPHGARSPT